MKLTKPEQQLIFGALSQLRSILVENLGPDAWKEYAEDTMGEERKQDMENLKLCISICTKIEGKKNEPT